MFNMRKNLVGLDIGSSTIKLVELNKTPAGITLLSGGIIDNPLLELEDKNSPEAEQRLSQSIEEACREFGIKEKNVALGTTEVIFDYLKFPVLREEELARAVRLEAEQRISSDLNQVIIDYKRSGIKDKDGQENILLVAVSKDMANKKVEIVEKAGLNPLIMDVEPLALLNCFMSIEEETLQENESIGILNIGADFTNLGILSKESVPTVRNINFGADKFNAFISGETRLSWKEVEAIKKDHEQLKQKINVLQMLEKQTFSFVNEIQNSIAYTSKMSNKPDESQQTASEIKKIFLTGGGCLTPEIDSFLSKTLNIEVSRWNPFEKVNFSKSVDDFLKPLGYLFPVAVGLGMRTV